MQTDIRDVCHTVFQRWVAQLVDPSRSKASSTATRSGGSGSSSLIVSRLLEGITDLCVFFGRDVTEDFVLPMLFTFLNQDWEVKTVFLKQVRSRCRSCACVLDTAAHGVSHHRSLE